MHELKVKIPFWYRPLILFMSDFWNDLPEEEEGCWSAGVDHICAMYREEGKRVHNIKSKQEAYLIARRLYLFSFVDVLAGEFALECGVWETEEDYRLN